MVTLTGKFILSLNLFFLILFKNNISSWHECALSIIFESQYVDTHIHKPIIYTMHRFVQGGYCVEENFCALENDECANDVESPIVFQSSREIQESTFFFRAHGGVCLAQESVKEKKLGNCTDNSCSVKNAILGSCDRRCSWSPESCAFGEEWSYPVEECTCDRTQTGACVKNDKVFCAVSEKGCDAFSSWLSPLDVVESYGILCYVCDIDVSNNTNSIGNPLIDVLFHSNPKETLTSHTTINNDHTAKTKFNGINIQNNKGFLFIIGAGSAFVIFGLVAIAAISLKRNLRKQNRKASDTTTTIRYDDKIDEDSES